MRRTSDTNQNHWEPRRNRSQRLRQQHEQREKCEDKHRLHTCRIRIHAAAIDKDCRQLTAVNGEHRNGIKREYQRHTQRIRCLDTELCVQIRRRPEEEEPPHAVRHELTDDKRPRLFESETLPETNLLLILLIDHDNILFMFILLDVFQLRLVHIAALVWRGVHKHPQSHPDEAQRTDDDKRHLPTPCFRQHRDGHRGNQRTNRSAGVEDGSRISPVFLREILRRHLDGSREVTRLTQSQDTARGQEEIHAHGRQNHDYVARRGNQLRRTVHPDIMFRRDTTDRVQTSTRRPNADRPKITLLRTHPVDKPTSKQHTNRINNGKHGCYRTVVSFIPMELRLDKFVPRQREYLTIQIIDRRRKEQHRTDCPSVIRHFFIYLLKRIHDIQKFIYYFQYGEQI